MSETKVKRKKSRVLLSFLLVICVLSGVLVFFARKQTEKPTPQDSSAIGGIIASMVNNLPEFQRNANLRSDQLDVNSMLVPASPIDNGDGNGQGQFRMYCLWSHYAYDDPIVYPGQPGKSHLHLFYGNTGVNAFTTQDSLVNSGGGSCQGGVLNRTGYWMPALLDGQGNVKVPSALIVYYKTYKPGATQRMPQGLQMIAGDFTGIGTHHWSCGGSGTEYNVGPTIPNCGSDYLHSSVEFPQCWDGQNLGSADQKSHMAFTENDSDCPADHP